MSGSVPAPSAAGASAAASITGSTPATAASQTAKAIAAITARQQQTLSVPEIDFTQHQLDSGEVVSTNERVVKDVSPGDGHGDDVSRGQREGRKAQVNGRRVEAGMWWDDSEWAMRAPGRRERSGLVDSTARPCSCR